MVLTFKLMALKCHQRQVVVVFTAIGFIYERELTFMFAMARPSVCRLSVTFVHPTLIEIFGNFLRHLVPWTPINIQVKFYGDRPRGTPPSGELNTRGVTKYSDFKIR